MFFFVWLAALSMILSGSIHVAASGITSVFFIANIPYVYIHIHTTSGQAIRVWHSIFKVMQGKNRQPRSLYPTKFSFRFDGEIKNFTDKQKLREFSINKPALQQMLKELL